MDVEDSGYLFRAGVEHQSRCGYRAVCEVLHPSGHIERWRGKLTPVKAKAELQAHQAQIMLRERLKSI